MAIGRKNDPEKLIVELQQRFKDEKMEEEANTLKTIQEDFKACKNAAIFVKPNSENWVRQAVMAIQSNNNILDSQEKVDNFKDDIEKYIEWLWNSLDQGRELSLKQFLPVRSIDNLFLYHKAIEYIESEVERAELLSKESGYIKFLLKRGREKL